MDKKTQDFNIDDTKYETEVPDGYVKEGNKSSFDPKEIRSIIPGIIVDIKVKKGQKISAGDVLVTLEAMKMFNEIEAEFKCKIIEILKEDAAPVEFGEPLFKVERL